MTIFEKGTWITNGRDAIYLVDDSRRDWMRDFKELKHAPNLEVVVKKVLLSEVEPKVGMKIKHDGSSVKTIVFISTKGVCAESVDGPMFTVAVRCYPIWEVVSTPEATEEPRLLTVEESLMPEHFGKFGKWLSRIGEEISGRLDKTTGELAYVLPYPVTVEGHTYTNKGRFFCVPHISSDNDLSAFLGWEE
jgi:hypothetical protein